MTRYRLLILGVAAYLLFLLILFPATTAWSLLAPTNSPLQLHGINGSIWQGSANQASWNGKPLGALHWDMQLLSLLTGKIGTEFSIQTSQGYLQGTANSSLGFGSFNLADLKGQLPIEELMQFAPPMPIPVAVSGTVSVDIPELELELASMSAYATGRINWHSAEVLSPQAFTMGNLQADIDTNEQGVVAAQLKDLGGPLKLEAEVQLKPDRSYSLSGNVAATRDAEASLEQALAWLGKADGEGRHRLNLNGRL